jgi:carbamate kinase
MGPKVEAAASFARASGHTAVIGSLDQLSTILAGNGGTRISVSAEGMETR